MTWGPETTSPCIPCDEGGGGKVLDVLVLESNKDSFGKGFLCEGRHLLTARLRWEILTTTLRCTIVPSSKKLLAQHYKAVQRQRWHWIRSSVFASQSAPQCAVSKGDKLGYPEAEKNATSWEVVGIGVVLRWVVMSQEVKKQVRFLGAG